MTDDNNDFEDEDLENGQNQKKKKGSGETDRQGRESVQVSEGFYAYMASIGASKSLVAEILRSWRHLRGEGLLKAINTFAQKMSSRASAHVEVDIKEDRKFAIVHRFVTQFFKKAPPTLTQKRSFDISRNEPK